MGTAEKPQAGGMKRRAPSPSSSFSKFPAGESRSFHLIDFPLIMENAGTVEWAQSPFAQSHRQSMLRTTYPWGIAAGFSD